MPAIDSQALKRGTLSHMYMLLFPGAKGYDDGKKHQIPGK